MSTKALRMARISYVGMHACMSVRLLQTGREGGGRRGREGNLGDYLSFDAHISLGGGGVRDLTATATCTMWEEGGGERTQMMRNWRRVPAMIEKVSVSCDSLALNLRYMSARTVHKICTQPRSACRISAVRLRVSGFGFLVWG